MPQNINPATGKSRLDPDMIIHDIGEAAQWEYIRKGIPDGLPDGSLLMFAEVIHEGRKYTLYFDTTPQEAEDPEALKDWLLNNWDWNK